MSNVDHVFDAGDDAFGKQEPGHQVAVVPWRPHRHRQRSFGADMRFTVLEDDLKRFLDSDEVAGVLAARSFDALDLCGDYRVPGHTRASLQGMNPSKKGSDLFFCEQSQRLNCQIFKSSRQENTYIYLPEGTGIDSLPNSLRDVFGTPEKVLDVVLDKDTRLAQADASQVMQAIRERGYYLQLPPDIYGNKHNPWA